VQRTPISVSITEKTGPRSKELRDRLPIHSGTRYLLPTVDPNIRQPNTPQGQPPGVVNVRNYIQQLNQKVHYRGCANLLNAVQYWKEVEAQKRDFTLTDPPMKWFREGYRHLLLLELCPYILISNSQKTWSLGPFLLSQVWYQQPTTPLQLLVLV